MSLAYTAPTYSEMYEFIAYKLYYKIDDESDTWDTWTTAVASGTAAQQAAIDKYDGRVMTVGVDQDFLPSWTEPAYVTKWSGGCMEDYSSGMGGFCLIESNDADLSGTTTTAADIYGVSGAKDTVQNGSTNRIMTTYRLSADDFANFRTAWADTDIVDTNVNEKDGRCWYNTVLNGDSLDIDSSDSAMLSFLDYAYCDRDDNDWTCQLYLRAEDEQEAGYPAFRTPGVVTGYYISSYLPGVEELSYSEVTDFLVYDSAMGVTTYAAAILAGVASLMF